jgi:hypothetical protein
MMVGMVDTSSLAGVLRASQPPVRRQPRPTPQPVAPTQNSRLNDMFSGYARNQGIFAQEKAKGFGSGAADFAVRRGVSDSLGLRAGALAGDIVSDPSNLIAPGLGLAAGLGLTALKNTPEMSNIARQLNPSRSTPALETGETIAARRDAINRLLDLRGPTALETYLQRPLTAYLPTMNPNVLRQFFGETSERIPAGTQMYRAPSAGQVRRQGNSKSVPLPREVGAEWLPNRIQSAGGSGDLQTLGGLLRRPEVGPGVGRRTVGDTGGNQYYAPGMVAIEAMEDLPGIYNLNAYLEAISKRTGVNYPTRSSFDIESVLAPQTRYVVRDFVPDAGEGFPTWFLNAYAR